VVTTGPGPILVITVFADLFRRCDVSGWGEAGWSIFVLVLPLIGSLTYLITQARTMVDRGAISQEEFEQLKRRVLV
jgi:hypothetical protein